MTYISPQNQNAVTALDQTQLNALAELIQLWGREQGFQQIAITDTDLDAEQPRLESWLDKGYHGSMQWLAERREMRTKPEQLVPGALRVISARMDYLPPDTDQIKVLKSPDQAYISRYSLGRDYHKLIRKRLAKIADNIRQHCDAVGIEQRPFVDSAPVMERPLAQKAGLGWVGKHTLLLNPHAGSWFFLGEIFTNLPLPVSNQQHKDQCGTCQACLQICPTDAFPKPYELDARRCISYLTIENKGPIPEEYREPIGNRVFGCDDCQAICPWNKFAKPTCEKDFHPRHGLQNSRLIDLFLWDEKTFLKHTEGSAIRRIGYERWLRNLAVGLGNANPSVEVVAALQKKKDVGVSPLVEEHIDWAIHRQQNPRRRRRKIKRTSDTSPVR
ncbi:tRNA epoxyqueuosine(34) reductase QueG [Teredinibacter turnerae]|uniref:tRNA epoxyqueuosine(34) reductase QueG n=1 Tax=Teredinibacter turnerae TaxID=2426 RepID=UPI0003A1B2B0|nr:tRNA epoxyqueuosine(34) reductase QueG [Teredinibacter turnerae]